ncbi:MAG: 50S ribosomal protein L25/general stress protein Ctc [Paludibacteraceae bacterium]|nr:50S ribosomal protein L25/general stress protein Ctc [Paludibacteraceae bacterium]
MKTFELSGVVRNDLGRKAAKNIRIEENIPCVLYGGKENINFTVKAADVRKLIYTPTIYEVKLTIDGKEHMAVLKDIQYHPVSDNILHIDFLEVDAKKPIVFSVPIKTEGLAAGVRAGGKLVLEVRKLKVKALCKDIPECLVVNVENLELGKTIKAGELSFPNLQIVNNKETLVVGVKMTRAARGAAAAAEK